MISFINKMTSMLQGKSDKEGSCSTDKGQSGGNHGDKSGGCCGGHCH